MYLNTRITGPAGMGVNSTAEIIMDIFSKLGYDLITDIEYESRIKGGINYFDINISDSGDKFLTNKVDILISFNEASLKQQLSNLKIGATIVANQKIISLNKLELEGKYNIISMEIDDEYENIYLLGIYIKYLRLDLKLALEQIEKTFAKKGIEVVEKNKQIIKDIYELKVENGKLREENVILNQSQKSLKKLFIQKIGEAKNLIYGNKAVAKGAIEGGLEFYSAYPMTPASSILTEIINDGRIKYIQNEDEIAVINSALGASFTGARAMSGTSGGGFALMTEALSFAVQAEISITIVLSQRAGPSTGTPTYHETGDISFSLYPTFGDFEHIVIYPSNLEEAYFFAGLALNIADKYQTQVIYLIDKQASEMFGTVEKLVSPKLERGIILENPNTDYKRYEITKNGISPRVVVGTENGEFIATSYEHDEYGTTTENSEIKKAMTEKRFRKLNNFFESEGYLGYEIINTTAKKMLIVAGFTSYTAKKFVKENPEFGLVIIKFLKPLDRRLKDELINKEELIFVESNYSGQIENYIIKEFGLQNSYLSQGEAKGISLKISHLRKYDLVPFYIEDFEELLS